MRRPQRNYTFALLLFALSLPAEWVQGEESSSREETAESGVISTPGGQLETNLLGVLEKVDSLEARVGEIEAANSQKHEWWWPVVLSVILGGVVGYGSGRIASIQERNARQNDARFLHIKLPSIRKRTDNAVTQTTRVMSDLRSALDYSITTPFFSYKALMDDNNEWMHWWSETKYLAELGELELPKPIGAIDDKHHAIKKLAKLVDDYDATASSFLDKWNGYVDFVNSLSVYGHDRFSAVRGKYGAEDRETLLQDNCFQNDVKAKYDELVGLMEQLRKDLELVQLELEHTELVAKNAA